MDHLVTAGLTPMIPPVLVRESALEGTGFFPEAREQVYEVPRDELFLVGTAEVPLAAYHGDEILDREDLPLRYAGFSTCFRREAGPTPTRREFWPSVRQGGDVRVHRSRESAESTTAFCDQILVHSWRCLIVVNIAGDLGASGEEVRHRGMVYGRGAYREITSCSNTTDYQARRLKVRIKGESSNVVAHTLNGTACAVGRTILALLENHQQPDGSVLIPEALRVYTGFDVIGP
jgi:seryl-tRNA synthetase